MKITLKSGEDSEGCAKEEMVIDGKSSEYVVAMWDCPEDATIERGLISCSDIISYMKRAHKAGVAGEEFAVTEEALDD